jgi:hypothetical protein
MAQTKQPKKKKPGRPQTRPKDVHQRSIWLPDALRADVARALIQPRGKPYEFSKLVDYLLRQWLERGAKLPKE